MAFQPIWFTVVALGFVVGTSGFVLDIDEPTVDELARTRVVRAVPNTTFTAVASTAEYESLCNPGSPPTQCSLISCDCSGYIVQITEYLIRADGPARSVYMSEFNITAWNQEGFVVDADDGDDTDSGSGDESGSGSGSGSGDDGTVTLLPTSSSLTIISELDFLIAEQLTNFTTWCFSADVGDVGFLNHTVCVPPATSPPISSPTTSPTLSSATSSPTTSVPIPSPTSFPTATPTTLSTLKTQILFPGSLSDLTPSQQAEFKASVINGLLRRFKNVIARLIRVFLEQGSIKVTIIFLPGSGVENATDIDVITIGLNAEPVEVVVGNLTFISIPITTTTAVVSTATVVTTPQPSSGNDNKLGDGEIAAIVICTVFAVGFLAYVIYKRNNRQGKAEFTNYNEETSWSRGPSAEPDPQALTEQVGKKTTVAVAPRRPSQTAWRDGDTSNPSTSTPKPTDEISANVEHAIKNKVSSGQISQLEAKQIEAIHNASLLEMNNTALMKSPNTEADLRSLHSPTEESPSLNTSVTSEQQQTTDLLRKNRILRNKLLTSEITKEEYDHMLGINAAAAVVQVSDV